eukprot:m.362528 g.362528  ORF g.362528 m.362528 type:complete len:255 (-) comp56017_c0_seq19:18-782(-)
MSCWKSPLLAFLQWLTKQDAQNLVRKKHRLALGDICVLAQFWKLDIKLEMLRTSNLTLQGIVESKPASLKRKLACNYGTAVALISFLSKLTDSGVLGSPRNGCTDLLETALRRADCSTLKSLFVEQGIADDILIEVDLDTLGLLHADVAQRLDAFEAAVASSIQIFFPLSFSLLYCWCRFSCWFSLCWSGLRADNASGTTSLLVIPPPTTESVAQPPDADPDDCSDLLIPRAAPANQQPRSSGLRIITRKCENQ